MNVRDVLSATLESDTLRTSGLLKKPSGLRLVWRMANTEAVKWVHLRGLIEFFKRGGSVSELNPSDMTAFRRRMGSDVKNYKYGPLKITRLSTDEPRFLVELHQNGPVRDAYLALALK